MPSALLSVSLFVAALLALPPFSAVPMSTSPRTADAAPPLTTVPFVLVNNHPYVSVQVGDADPLGFILDTGAQVMVLDTDVAARLGVASEPLGQAAGGGGEGTVEMSLAHNITLGVGSAEATYGSVYVLGLSATLSEHEGRPVAGLLGHDFFQRYVVEMDHVGGEMHLYDPSTYVYEGDGIIVPIEITNLHPHVQGTITMPGREPVPTDFLIDTGASGPVYFATPFVDRHDLLAGTPTRVGFVGGIGGLTTQPVGRLAALTFGPVEMEGSTAYFSQDQSGGFAGLLGADGIIGTEILRRYTVIWDYSRQRVILEPNDRMGEPFDHDIAGRSGLYVMAGGADLRTFRVEHVVDGTPASEAGLAEGDVILEIDGEPASGFTVERIRQRFVSAPEVHLRVWRGEGEHDAHIVQRRLLD